MPHFRVDDGLDAHPKAQRAGDEALGMWVRAGAWCMRYLTDGFVPAWWVKQQPRGMAKAKRLVEAELWHPSDRDGEKGWQFHEFTGNGRQDSRAQIEAERAKWRQKKATQRGMSPGDTPGDRAGEKQSGEPVFNKKRAGNGHSTHQFASRNGHENAISETHANMAVSNPVTSVDSEMSPGDTTPVSPGDSLHVTRDPTQPIKRTSGYVESASPDSTGREPRSAPIRPDANRLVAERIPDSHPNAVRTELRLQASALLNEGQPADVVAAALDLWTAKNVHPKTLPSLVSEVINQRGKPTGNSANGKPHKMRALVELAQETAAHEARNRKELPA